MNLLQLCWDRGESNGFYTNNKTESSNNLDSMFFFLRGKDNGIKQSNEYQIQIQDMENEQMHTHMILVQLR